MRQGASVPAPLVLNPSGGGNCSATQTITNTTDDVTVGWQWANPQGGFTFYVNTTAKMGWPKDNSPGIAPGNTDTLTASTKCLPPGSQPKLYPILLTDTLGDQYTFVLQVQPASS